ncbi:PHD finger protein 14 [Toxorhynchites rutilus septentrionalis]|uniref:PHD finger protein 14 n=1 Tax=Toxorhynchites rutilus septentrionalis TaxID=329112 RepID=UPI00247A9F55|nr:PHD finger protein 14 [Toxorhynchites rutilus septentrionalis]
MKRKTGTDSLTTQTLLDFDLGESSSDSDFRIEDHDDDSDDFSAGSKDEDDGGKDDDDDDDGDEESDDDDEESGDDDEEEEEDGTDSGTTGSGSKGGNTGAKIEVADAKPLSLVEMLEKSNKGVDKATLKLLATPICCACLGDRSDDQNEIVECDGCGVTVHEGCYGVSESTSVSSTISSCSTEPWFCEACKAGISDPDCELCPNKGGIFKETDVGKWVHLVCALYVPGVAFGEVDQLSSVTLFEMPYNKWGAKTCSLCDDAKFARTGVCIGCDAGMCKTYFHVTCAQYAGLLSEAHSEEADQADPFYAHCKIHSDKTLIKHRKRNYNGIKLKAQNRKLEQVAKRLEKPSPEQVRIERKLAKHRKKYVNLKETKNPPWVPTQKMPRLLTTSATACKKMLLKAELMGIDSAAMEFQEAQMTALADVRKKWHIPPAFSVEFIGYYLDRTIRLKEIKKNLQQQAYANKRLLEDQQTLREKYDSAMKINQDALNENDELKDAVRKLYDDIHALCPNKALIPIEQIGKPPSVPPIQNPSVVINTPSSTPPARTITVPTAAALKMGVGFPLQNLIAPGKRDDTGRILSTQCKQNSEELLNECGICKRCSDQHLLAKCDTCHLYYHLGCLNPPLTRHPKKSKLYGWQCSECDKSDDSGPENVILPKAPRKSRTRYSKDGIIVPYDMPSPEFERSPESITKRSRKSTGTNSTSESPSKTAAATAVTNGIETKEVLLELPKIDQELASKLGAIETSVEMTPKAVLAGKRGRKKKILEPIPGEGKDTSKEDVLKEVKSEPVVSIAVDPVPAQEQHDKPKEESTPKGSSSSEAGLKEKKKEKQLKATSDVSAPVEAEITALGSSRESLTAAPTGATIAAAPPAAPAIEPEAESSVTFPSHSSSHKHSKRKKEKHRNRSPHEDGSPTKEHKRKRKRKNHDMENPNDAASGNESTIHAAYTIPSDDNRPRIKIKIKSVLDGSNTHTIFYVPNDSIVPPCPSTSSEPVVTSTPLSSPAATSALPKSVEKPDPLQTSSSAPELSSTATKAPTPSTSTSSRPQSSLGASTSAPTICSGASAAAAAVSNASGAGVAAAATANNKPPPALGRGRGRRLSVGRPSRALLNSTLNSSGNSSAAAGSSESVCDVCHSPGTQSNIVQCDECHKNYHFGCLDPPVKKSPKRRGYSWHCADCDPTDTETN